MNILKDKKQLIKSMILICFLSFFILPQIALAAESADKYGLDTTAGEAKLATSQTDLPSMVGKVINYLLGFLGVVFMILVLVGGYLWMTSGGNEEQVKKAKGFITAAVNGLIVVSLAYALAYIIVQSLSKATG